jgi:cell division protein FtsI/penicillin-binding protein 2
LKAARPGWHPAFPHAWFVGWAPATRPQILVAAVLEHAGVGGEVAAPVVRRIIDGYFTEVAPPRPRRARRRHD